MSIDVLPHGVGGPSEREWRARAAIHGAEGAYWATRRCFVPFPKAHVVRATTLLSDAVDALLAGDREAAASGILAADTADLLDWNMALTGGVDHDVTHWRPVALGPVPVRGRVDDGNVERHEDAIFRRDTHRCRCRYCGCRVVRRDARTRLRALLPGTFRWTNAHGDHAAFHALSACFARADWRVAGSSRGR